MPRWIMPNQLPDDFPGRFATEASIDRLISKLEPAAIERLFFKLNPAGLLENGLSGKDSL